MDDRNNSISACNLQGKDAYKNVFECLWEGRFASSACVAALVCSSENKGK